MNRLTPQGRAQARRAVLSAERTASEKAPVGASTPRLGVGVSDSTSESTQGRTARLTVDRSMSEAEWQAQVVACAEAHGWVVWHDNDSRRNDSGFPDLVLLRERVIWAELKKIGGRVSPTQRWFRDVLIAAGAEAYVWYPTQWEEVQRVLAGKDAV